MAYVLTTLWPLFILIAAGFTMQRRGFPNPAFWPGAERFNYFVLFPALLFNSLSTAPPAILPCPGFLPRWRWCWPFAAPDC
jgi:malonate transporter and related proteins